MPPERLVTLASARRSGSPASYGRDARTSSKGVPRTLKEAGCRRPESGCGAVQEMEARPSEAALQGEASNHRELRRSRAGVVSVMEKAHKECVRYEPGRRTQVNHRRSVETSKMTSKLRVSIHPWDKPGSDLHTDWAASGIYVARAWLRL